MRIDIRNHSKGGVYFFTVSDRIGNHDYAGLNHNETQLMHESIMGTYIRSHDAVYLLDLIIDL